MIPAYNVAPGALPPGLGRIRGLIASGFYPEASIRRAGADTRPYPQSFTVDRWRCS